VPLTLSSVTIRNDANHSFSAGVLPPTVAGGAAVTLDVTFAAAAQPEAEQATIIIVSDASNASASEVPLLGRSGDASCADLLKNGEESEVDCGGSLCPGCALGGACTAATDCGLGLGCVGGKCGPCSDVSQCRSGQVCGGGVCIGCALDSECAAGSTCATGACAVCPGATGAIDTRTDPKNCGKCGTVCAAPLNASPMCLAGKCGRGPCAPGHFDLTGTFGCESTCVKHVCIDETGKQTPVSNDPLPETGAAFRSFSTGGSYGGLVQTGAHLTNTATVGEETPASLRSSGTHFQNISGMKSTQ
jgi:hypothetical protein